MTDSPQNLSGVPNRPRTPPPTDLDTPDCASQQDRDYDGPALGDGAPDPRQRTLFSFFRPVGPVTPEPELPPTVGVGPSPAAASVASADSFRSMELDESGG